MIALTLVSAWGNMSQVASRMWDYAVVSCSTSALRGCCWWHSTGWLWGHEHCDRQCQKSQEVFGLHGNNQQDEPFGSFWEGRKRRRLVAEKEKVQKRIETFGAVSGGNCQGFFRR